MLNVFAPFVIGALITLTLMLVLRPVASRVGLVDVPGGRKAHHGEVPIIGGIAMFLGALVAIMAAGFAHTSEAILMVAAGLMVLVGVMDDRFDLPPFVRILAELAAAITLVLASGYTVGGLGNLLGFGSIHLGPLAGVFTIVAAVALINGFNMLDGLDGLAGGVAMVALSGLAWYFALVAHGDALALSLGLVGSVAGFLMFNLPADFNRELLSFMGDAGSTLLGFMLAGLSLIAIQPHDQGMPPVVVLWLLPVPILELFTSTFRRAATGLSPLQADRGHFHYRLLDAGFSVRAIFLLYVVVSTVSAVVGLAAWRAGASEAHLFYAFVGVSVLWLLLMGAAMRWAARLPQSLKRGERLRRHRRGTPTAD